MSEELDNVVETVETTEKTFTQAELDDIVGKRLAREKEKFADYDTLKSENATLQEVSKILAESGAVNGTPAEQVAYLKEFYGMSTKQAEKMVDDNTTKLSEEDSKALTYVKVERLEKSLNDDDIVKEYEKLLSIPVKQRSDEDEIKLDVLYNRYRNVRYNADFKEAKEWYEGEGVGEFDELMKDDDFIDFVKGSNGSLLEISKR